MSLQTYKDEVVCEIGRLDALTVFVSSGFTSNRPNSYLLFEQLSAALDGPYSSNLKVQAMVSNYL